MSHTELIKIDKDGIFTKGSCQLPDYPLKVSHAKGTFLAQSESNIICGGDPPTNECYKFDVDEWKKMPSMKTARYYHGMTSTNDEIFVCGGYDAILFYGGYGYTSRCEKFENGKWISIQSLPTKLSNHCMITINNETILSIGGKDGDSEVRR